MPDAQWLREMAEEDLKGLFCDDEDAVREQLRTLIRQAREDMHLEERLIDLVDTSIDLANDDTMGSVWAIVALAEIPSPRSTTVLVRALTMESDEILQDVAGVALLRLGAASLEELMEILGEEESSVALRRQGYLVLGRSGCLGDHEFCERVRDFFESRIATEKYLERSEQALEELALAVAELGATGFLKDLRKIQQEHYSSSNVAIEDAVARLEDNEDGVPFVGRRMPWQERYGWLFEDEAPDDDDETADADEDPDSPRSGFGSVGLDGPHLS